ncbi:MAG TPA: hypothetical protein VGN34_33735, partial [Ktedonobacteraceae bacterium]
RGLSVSGASAPGTDRPRLNQASLHTFVQPTKRLPRPVGTSWSVAQWCPCPPLAISPSQRGVPSLLIASLATKTCAMKLD